MAIVFIGIDDTDFGDSPGTGNLARRVSDELTRLGGKPLGVTRHQFLVDPRIPDTSHNSGLCVGTDWTGTLADLDFIFDMVRDCSAEGSDPGVCISLANAVPAPVVAWGEAAMREVLTMDDARTLALAQKMNLRALGGTGQAIIGAMGSVGLRAGGDHGRYADLPGLRQLNERVTEKELVALGIDVEFPQPAANGNSKNHNGIHTLGWLRPRLSRGKPCVPVEWSDEHDAWIPVDRKKFGAKKQGGH